MKPESLVGSGRVSDKTLNFNSETPMRNPSNHEKRYARPPELCRREAIVYMFLWRGGVDRNAGFFF